MSQLASRLAFSFGDYLEWENQQSQRHDLSEPPVMGFTEPEPRP